jgi:hypothetical protein
MSEIVDGMTSLLHKTSDLHRKLSQWMMGAGLLLLMASLLGTEVLGQATTYVSPSSEKNGRFGASIAGMGDLDGDGTADFLVGAPGEQVGSSAKAGRAYLFSGENGGAIYTLTAPDPVADGYFGTAVATLDAVTGDGIPEIAIGAIGPNRKGRVYLFNGREGTLLRTLKSPSPTPGGLFGRTVAGTGDLNGDDIPDLAVGAIGDGEDRVYLFSGASGDLLYTLRSPTDGHDHFGQVASVGDVDGDDVPDLLIGASTTTVGDRSTAGRAYLYSGQNGKRIHTLTPPSSKVGHFGYLTAAGGDINGDDISEAIVGAAGNSGAAGRIYVYNGTDGTVLRTLRPPSPTADGYRGYSALSVGDVAESGASELVLGTRLPARDSVQTGHVYLYDGATGQRLRTFSPPATRKKGQFGASVGCTRAEDDSSRQILLVGAPEGNVQGKAGAGRVYRYSLP